MTFLERLLAGRRGDVPFPLARIDKGQFSSPSYSISKDDLDYLLEYAERGLEKEKRAAADAWTYGLGIMQGGEHVPLAEALVGLSLVDKLKAVRREVIDQAERLRASQPKNHRDFTYLRAKAKGLGRAINIAIEHEGKEKAR